MSTLQAKTNAITEKLTSLDHAEKLELFEGVADSGDYDLIEAITETLLNRDHIKFNIVLVNELVSKFDSEMDFFSLNLTANGKNSSFDYYQGVGHRAAKREKGIKAIKASKIQHGQGVSYVGGTQVHQFIKKPTTASILYCLLLDSRATDESFIDWCNNFGADSDSITAYKTYESCISTSIALDSIIDSQAQELLSALLSQY